MSTVSIVIVRLQLNAKTFECQNIWKFQSKDRLTNWSDWERDFIFIGCVPVCLGVFVFVPYQFRGTCTITRLVLTVGGCNPQGGVSLLYRAGSSTQQVEVSFGYEKRLSLQRRRPVPSRSTRINGNNTLLRLRRTVGIPGQERHLYVFNWLKSFLSPPPVAFNLWRSHRVRPFG